MIHICPIMSIYYLVKKLVLQGVVLINTFLGVHFLQNTLKYIYLNVYMKFITSYLTGVALFIVC